MNCPRALLAAGVAVAALGAPASAAAITDSVSQNWAGYAATGPRFKKVSGSWIVPKIRCTAGRKTYSGIWVGLGGFSANSDALEQVGTDQNCGSKGKTHYTAWYELVPDDPVTITMTVRPGDRIDASVSVSGKSVTLRLRNRTRDKTFAATKHMSSSSPDTTSAEWILEAPALCDDTSCEVLPLADFGTASLSKAAATTSNGNTRAISKANWSIQRLRLEDPAGGAAVPSKLSADGASFKVTYRAQAASKRAAKRSRIVGRRL